MVMLSEEQARKFEELKGKPFKLDRRSLFGGRGERDGRGRGKRDGRGRGKRDGRGGDEQKNKGSKRPDPDESI